MKANQLFAVLTALTAGCGVVNLPVAASDDAGIGSDSGSDMGSDMGSATDPPHDAGQFYGSVHDERNDTIDFSTGVPVHTHGGTPIGLSGTGCPAIYKYAYLESVMAPKYGSETTSNPLAWHIVSDVTALDPSATAYRVRDAANNVFLDWTAMAPDGGGVYTIDLRRDGAHAVAGLTTKVGNLYVDARFRNTSGTDEIKTTCWENHPLAAPLEVVAPTAASLFTMSFADHSPLSQLMNAGSFTTSQFGADVASLPITQLTAEPTTITISVAKPTGTTTKDVVDTYVPAGNYADNYSCGTGQCPSPGATTHATGSAALAGTWQLRIVDFASGAVLCRSTAANPLTVSCTIPARADGAFAHPYTAILSLAAEPTLTPPMIGQPYADQTVGTAWVSGSTSGAAGLLRCSSQHIVIAASIYYQCTESAYFGHFSLANQAKIGFNAITFSATTGDAALATTPPYIGPLELAAKTWDAGTDGF